MGTVSGACFVNNKTKLRCTFENSNLFPLNSLWLNDSKTILWPEDQKNIIETTTFDANYLCFGEEYAVRNAHFLMKNVAQMRIDHAHGPLIENYFKKNNKIK